MKTTRLFIIILMLCSLGQVMADLYLPSLPAIKTGLFTNFDSVQLTVSLYMIGFALSPLVYGPLSDGVGRRKPLLAGMMICLIGSLMCLLTPSINFLMAGRLLQGLGAGAGSTLAISIMRDCYSRTELAKVNSYLSIGNIAIMVSAPLIGSYIQHCLQWRFNFLFLLVYAATITFVVIRALPETNQDLHIDHIKPRTLLKNIGTTLSNKSLMILGSIGLLAYAGITSFVTEGSIIIQHNLGYSALVFGWLSLANGVSYSLFSLANARLLNRFSMLALAITGLSVMLLAGVAMLIFNLLGIINLWSLIIPTVIYIGGVGMTFPNIFALAAPHYAKTAGLGGAIMRTLQILGGVIAATILAHIPQKNMFVLAVALVVFTSGAFLLSLALAKRDMTKA